MRIIIGQTKDVLRLWKSENTCSGRFHRRDITAGRAMSGSEGNSMMCTWVDWIWRNFPDCLNGQSLLK